MALDKETYEFLVNSFKKQTQAEKRRLSELLEKKLRDKEPHIVGDQKMKQEARDGMVRNFWIEHKPKLNDFGNRLEKQLFQDFGGSMKSAEQMITPNKTDIENSNSKHLSSEKIKSANDNTQRKQQLRQSFKHTSQSRERGKNR